MKQQSFIVHGFKFAVALFTMAVCLALAVYAGWQHNWILLVVFLLIAAAFAFVCFSYGSILTLDETGVRRSFLGIPLRTMSWADIAEVGVVGLKVFNNNDPKHTGTRYIYFSPRTLDKDARFKLALEWPPRDMLYISYTHPRVEMIQMLWSGPIETYNAGNLFF